MGKGGKGGDTVRLTFPLVSEGTQCLHFADLPSLSFTKFEKKFTFLELKLVVFTNIFLFFKQPKQLLFWWSLLSLSIF